MSSKFFSSRSDKQNDGKYNTKNASSSRTNVKKQTQVKKSGRGK